MVLLLPCFSCCEFVCVISVVYAVQAQDLLAMDIATGASDPLVIFRMGGKEKRSSVVNANLHPKWNETFEFECSSGG